MQIKRHKAGITIPPYFLLKYGGLNNKYIFINGRVGGTEIYATKKTYVAVKGTQVPKRKMPRKTQVAGKDDLLIRSSTVTIF